MLTRQDQIRLNAVAQGKLTVEEVVTWFSALTDESRSNAIRWLNNASIQSGATEADVKDAIMKSGLRPTFTPAVALSTGRLAVQMTKLVNLSGKDVERAFRLLLALFSIADGRRRIERCKGACNHWWHHLDTDWEWESLLKERKSQLH